MRRSYILVPTVVLLLAAVAAVSAARAGRSARGRAGLGATSGAAPSPADALDVVDRGEVTIDSSRQQLIGIHTVRVERGPLKTSLRAAGFVAYDDTRVADVNLRVDGWIRDLDVASTGREIRSGQRLLSLYSPELLTLQTDYVLALKTRDQVRASAPDALAQADALLTTARRELERRDMPEADIRALDNSRIPTGEMTFLSPVTGVVTEKHVVRGRHVAAGESLYTVADLSVVWIEADVPEVDAGLVHVGTSGIANVDAYPGQPMTGRVIYVSPYLDEKTRTNATRLEFENSAGRFKPGMSAEIEFTLSAGEGLTVPRDAVLDSGTDQIVFVEHGAGTFQPRRVTVGRRLGNAVQILTGLTEGETVATGAAFFLDSESQISGSLPMSETPAMEAPHASRTSPVDIVLRTLPDPPGAGDTQFEVALRDPGHDRAADADVTIELFMPAMPSMNMPSMKNDITLAPMGGGTYRGSGRVPMSGSWVATVILSRDGVEIGRRRFPLIVQ